jgi:hypothetical protein
MAHRNAECLCALAQLGRRLGELLQSIGGLLVRRWLQLGYFFRMSISDRIKKKKLHPSFGYTYRFVLSSASLCLALCRFIRQQWLQTAGTSQHAPGATGSSSAPSSGAGGSATGSAAMSANGDTAAHTARTGIHGVLRRRRYIVCGGIITGGAAVAIFGHRLTIIVAAVCTHEIRATVEIQGGTRTLLGIHGLVRQLELVAVAGRRQVVGRFRIVLAHCAFVVRLLLRCQTG